MKLRIVQDHHAEVNPWYQLQEWNGQQWLYRYSDNKLDAVRHRMQQLAKGDGQFTVVEELES